MPELEPAEALALLEWRRQIFELYGEVRAADDPGAAWLRWRERRDSLFRTHSQSPVPETARNGFRGCRYFDYAPPARVTASISPQTPESRQLATSTGDSYDFVRFGDASFELYGSSCRLELYWLEGYGGGLFVPFRDETSGETTYTAGRYLLDTAKGADLGSCGERLVFDFNYAYNPSCAYDPRWACPLAPSANWLPLAVEAGER